MIKLLLVLVYVLTIGILLREVWKMLRQNHHARFSGWGGGIQKQLDTLVDEYQDNYYLEAIVHQSKLDIEKLRKYIKEYAYPVDIRTLRRSAISPNNLFIQSSLSIARRDWHFNESCLAEIITFSIHQYNNDSHKHPLTIQEFMERVLHHYEYGFVNELLPERP